MITPKAMLSDMQLLRANGKPKPFKILYLTYDKNRKRYGKVRILDGVILTKAKYSGKFEQRIINVHPEGLPSEVVSVHFDLILFFNNIPVT